MKTWINAIFRCVVVRWIYFMILIAIFSLMLLMLIMYIITIPRVVNLIIPSWNLGNELAFEDVCKGIRAQVRSRNIEGYGGDYSLWIGKPGEEKFVRSYIPYAYVNSITHVNDITDSNKCIFLIKHGLRTGLFKGGYTLIGFSKHPYVNRHSKFYKGKLRQYYIYTFVDTFIVENNKIVEAYYWDFRNRFSRIDRPMTVKRVRVVERVKQEFIL